MPATNANSAIQRCIALQTPNSSHTRGGRPRRPETNTLRGLQWRVTARRVACVGGTPRVCHGEDRRLRISPLPKRPQRPACGTLFPRRDERTGTPRLPGRRIVQANGLRHRPALRRDRTAVAATSRMPSTSFPSICLGRCERDHREHYVSPYLHYHDDAEGDHHNRAHGVRTHVGVQLIP